MAFRLYQLGRWSFRHRRIVAASWAAILAATILGSITLAGTTSDQFQLSSTESAKAFALIKDRAPKSTPDGSSALIVFKAPAGQTLNTAANRAAVKAALARTQTADVTSIDDPFTGGAVSHDGTVAYATVNYSKQSADLTATDHQRLSTAKTTAEKAGLAVVIGGDAIDSGGTPLTELLGIAIAFVILTLTFGSLIAAGMPLLTAILGVGIGVTAISTASGFVSLGSTTPALGVMLGLAVGIDYALFIMSRYQHEVREGRPLDEAAGRAVGTAGSAVIFAGLTVVIALAGLSVCGIGFLTQLGIAGAGVIILAVLIALTLVPALLGFAGNRVAAGRLKFLKAKASEGEDQRSNGRRWAETVTRFRVPVLVGGVLVAVLISLPVLSMRLALPDDATDPKDSDTRATFDLIAANFGAGANGPLIVVVDTKQAAKPIDAVKQVVSELDSMKVDVAAVVSPLGDTPAANAALVKQLKAVQFATITVIPQSGPSDEATKQLVNNIRTRLSGLHQQTGARALVTGRTAVDVDIAQALNKVFPLYLILVVGLAFVLLTAVFRSILVPLKAALGFLLSLGISLGATVAVFQWGWLNQLLGLDATAPVLFLLPLLLTGILFGLAMDYEVFLVSRMREAHIHGSPARQAIVIGFQHSARVVFAAALIMAGVFAGFALTNGVILKTIGFSLAVGVLADALLVRMTIVPAVMALLGDRVWWIPRWLDRVLPNLDIEGDQLSKRLD